MSYYSNRNHVSSNSSSGGVSFTGLLQIVFIILKLCHVIEWSWWWVLAPTWITVLLLTVVVGIVIVVAFFKG